MILASCQEVAEDTGPNEAVPAESGYPSLHTVPLRPQLSYPVAQRRAIIDGLIADRENARYSNQVVRYRTGLNGLPPPDTRPVAAAPPIPAADVSNAGAAPGTPDAVRDRPVEPPETEFDYHGDNVNSFLEEMGGDRRAPAGEIAPGPESDAAPIGRAIVRAGAARPVGSPAAADDSQPPAAVWAVPGKTAGFPTAASATGTREALAARPRLRAPGVVWGMVDMRGRRAGPATVVAQGADAGRISARTTSSPAPAPTAAASADSAESGRQRLRPPATALAGRAPGVVWGMVDMPEKSADPAAAANAAPGADTTALSGAASPVTPMPAPATAIETSDQNETTDGNENSVAPAAIAMAERPDGVPPFEPPADTAGIEVNDGLIAVSLAPSADGAGPLESIDFAPGSATLPPDASVRLERFLAEVKAPDALIGVVGEADTPALALDRALAVGLALVQRGVPADRLDLTLAPDAAGDQVRLSAVGSTP